MVRLMTFRTNRKDVDAATANHVLTHAMSTMRVPLEAERVNIDAGFFSAFASFQISEAEFTALTEKRSWRMKPLARNDEWELYNFRILFQDFPPSIEDGLYYSNATHRGGYDVLYDRGAQRAWMIYTRN